MSGYCFQPYSAGETPPNGIVRAGVDSDGTQIYVGRAEHEGEIVPAKVLFDKQVAYIPFGGQEIAKYYFEVLRTGNFVWESSSNGEIPYGSVAVGQTSDGEKLYMGRCIYDGTQTPGKIQASHGCLYIPFAGAEIRVTEYEILVLK